MNHKARVPANSTVKPNWSKNTREYGKNKNLPGNAEWAEGASRPGCAQPRRQKICSEHFSSDCVPGKVSLQSDLQRTGRLSNHRLGF